MAFIQRVIHDLLFVHPVHTMVVHFPIALTGSALFFMLLALWRRSDTLEQVAFANIGLAAVSTVVAGATGILDNARFYGGQAPNHVTKIILASTLLIEAAACYPRILLLLQQGWGIVGIAWAQVASSLVSAVLAWRLVPFPGSPLPGREVFRSVAVHTGRLFVGGFSGFLATRIDNVLVAGTIGETGMSFYSMAYNASRLPINVLERVTSFVLAPALAQIRGEPARVQEAVNQTLRHLYLLVAPVATLLFVCAPTLTAVVLGERWAPLAAPLRVMSLVAIAAPTLHATAAVLVSHGRAHWIAAPGAALLLFQVLAIPPMARRFGPIGAAGVDLAATLLVTWAMCHAARRAVAGVSWRPLGFLRLPALAAAAAGTLAWSAGLLAPGCVARLALQLGLIGAGYPALVWLLGGATLLKELAALVRGRAPAVPTA